MELVRHVWKWFIRIQNYFNFQNYLFSIYQHINFYKGLEDTAAPLLNTRPFEILTRNNSQPLSFFLHSVVIRNNADVTWIQVCRSVMVRLFYNAVLASEVKACCGT
jgi:hypothetical protein